MRAGETEAVDRDDEPGASAVCGVHTGGTPNAGSQRNAHWRSNHDDTSLPRALRAGHLTSAMYQTAAVAGPVREADSQRVAHSMPAAAEFGLLCHWLARCRHIGQVSEAVPAPFDRSSMIEIGFDAHAPALVLVKVKAEGRLSFRSEPFEQLVALAERRGRPLLIAWKHFSIWTLVSAERLVRTGSHYGISNADARDHNLLGILAGDYAFALRRGAGFHIRSSMAAAAGDHAAFTDVPVRMLPGGAPLSHFPPEYRSILCFVPLRRRKGYDAQSIVFESCGGHGFAHQFVVDWINGGLPSSRLKHSQVLRAGGWPSEIPLPSLAEILGILDKARRDNLVEAIFHQRPLALPSFMAESESEQA